MKIHMIRQLHRSIDQLTTDALAQMDLTAAQGCIMGYLNHRSTPPCPRDVEEAFDLSHACVSGILSRLEKKEFISLRPDEQDRRCKRIHVLPKGKDCHAHMHATFLQIEQQISRGFTSEEQALFNSLISRAIENMGASPEPKNRKEEP